MNLDISSQSTSQIKMQSALVAAFRMTTLILALAAYPATSAEFSFQKISEDDWCDRLDEYEGCITILMSGEIIKDDSVKLEFWINERAAHISKILDKKVRIGTIFLDSQGGDLLEAVKIGRLVRARLIQTQVTLDSQCNSACVMVLAGGVVRLPVGPVGIHSFYSTSSMSDKTFDEDSSRYNRISDMIHIFLKEVRVSEALLDHIKQVPHYRTHTLNFDELEQYGLIGIDPVYAQIKHSSIGNK